ncbi:MAG: S8 family serine peptidase, partial [Acidobacteria bacterium]|nr:S8 family serine peptidase [Acidobacteriota bacterium]
MIAFTPSAMAAGANTRADRNGPAGRTSQAGKPNSNAVRHKMDQTLTKRANGLSAGTSKVIVTLKPGYKLPAAFKAYAKKNIGIINGSVVEVPNGLLNQLANHPAVLDLHVDRPLHKANYRTSLTTGARAVQSALGFTGAGIGVAVIDSGVSTWHDDLTNQSSTVYPYGDQRVSAFVDFVNGQMAPYDDDGHGTHVAGTIAGNGYDSSGQKSGSAPDASLAVLKVLDANGQGTISNIIAALDWLLANHAQYNIRVVNMSVGAGVTESYWTDPLTLAAKRVVDAGVVVVAAAGNAGKNAAGEPLYGAIAAPGNAPWVLTVGASTTSGTPDRADDAMASFSSRGPTYLDWAAKPDLIAPGVSTYSLSVPGSTLFNLHPTELLGGSIPTAQPPYLALSGTSMAAPVVSGTVALMLQANPTLTPNAVKAILQYTAENRPGYDALTEGAGFLNALGAVRLAQFYATAQPGSTLPIQAMWSKHVFWGNHKISGGALDPAANAFKLGTNWGVAYADGGDNIVWGTADTGDNIVWGTADTGDNIVWGTDCGGSDCDNIVWGTACADATCDNIVWGTADEGDNIVWGTADTGDNIVWGTADEGDNIVWGTADEGDNIVWGTADEGDNIVWGTADDGDNIVWGTYTVVDAAGVTTVIPVVKLLNLDGLTD